MENFIVSARKYRPQSFDTVVGQEALTITLKNAIKEKKLAHAYLFCGPRGVGKTTCARIFAKTINCLSPNQNGEACNECESCVAFNEQRSYNIIELDAASNNSVEDIRSLCDQVRIPPQIGQYKVFIIDEVHMLSPSAFNAFLKTLEEPPAHAIFILATTEKHKILPTILSRCQIYDFNRMSVQGIVNHLTKVAEKEGVEAEPEALGIIAQKADGGMRDALSIFDQTVSFTQGHLTYDNVIKNLNVLDYDYFFKLTDLALENKIGETMLLFNEILAKGFQGDHFINGYASHMRDLLVSKDEATIKLLEVGDKIKEQYKEQAKKCSAGFLYKAIKLCNECGLNYRVSKNQRLLVELTLIEVAQITQPDDAVGSGRSPKKIIKPIKEFRVKVDVVSTVAAGTHSAPQAATPASTPQTQARKMPEGLNTTLPKTLHRGRPMTISITNPQQIKTQADIAVENARKQSELNNKTISANEQKPLEDGSLSHYWRNFASNMLGIEEAATKQRMFNSTLKILDANTFEAIVDNSIVQGYIDNLRPRIENYLREVLQNSAVTMKTRVSERQEVKRAFSNKEKFDMMVKENPALKDLQEMFGLTFA